MLTVVFLQKCFGRSDPMAEQMRRDRLSFRRFVGLPPDEKTPGHSTISTSRKRLIAPIRAFVEHPFAWIKGRLNTAAGALPRAGARNALDFALACNFCRSFSL